MLRLQREERTSTTDVVARLCRVTIAANRHSFDVELAADVPVIALIPGIAQLATTKVPTFNTSAALADAHSATADLPNITIADLALRALDNVELDESLSLTDNAIRDGDVLVLTVQMPTSPPTATDDLTTPIARVSVPTGSRASVAIGCVSAIIGTAMGISVVNAALPRVATLISLSLIAVIWASGYAVCRVRLGPPWPTATAALATMIGSVALGLRIPPGALTAPHLLTAATFGLVTAVVVHRSSAGHNAQLSSAFLGAATLCGVVVASSAISVTTALPLATVSMAATVVLIASLALMPAAALKLASYPTISLTTPVRLPSPESVRVRAQTAHRHYQAAAVSVVLSLGTCALVALWPLRNRLTDADADNPSGSLAGLLAILCLATTLLLRARHEGAPIIALAMRLVGIIMWLFGGCFVALSSGKVVVALVVAFSVSAAGFAAASTTTTTRHPLLRRGLEIAELLAISAAVPLALHGVGLFTWLRSW